MMNTDPKISVLTTLESNPCAIFTDKSLSVSMLVDALKKQHEGATADLSTDKGRKAIASRARSVVSAIMEAAGIGEDRAIKIVTAIASGAVPHVAISY